MRDYGSVYEIDVDQLSALEPDLVLTQGICDVCAVPERQVLSSVDGARILTLDAHDLAAIFQGIRDVGAPPAPLLRRSVSSQRCCDASAAVRARSLHRPRPRVLALEWLDPPYVPGHWVPEMIDIAGGEIGGGNNAPTIVPDGMVTAAGARTRNRADHAVRFHSRGDAARSRAPRRRAARPRAPGAPARRVAYFSRSARVSWDGLEMLASAIFPSVSLVFDTCDRPADLPLQRTSKIVRLATRDYGVQSAIAKGVLRPRSPFGRHSRR